MRLTRRRTTDDLSAMYRNGTLDVDHFDMPIPSKAGILLGTGDSQKLPIRSPQSRDGILNEQKCLGGRDGLARGTTQGAESEINEPMALELFPAVKTKSGAHKDRPKTANDRSFRHHDEDNYHDAPALPSHPKHRGSDAASREPGGRKTSLVSRTMRSESTPSRPSTSGLEATVHDTNNNGDRPLKRNGTEKKSKKLDISGLFPQQKGSLARIFVPNRWSKSPAMLKQGFNDFPEETIVLHLERPNGSSRYEAHKTVKSPPAEVSKPERMKIFDTEVHDSAKARAKRPPKGIKHWFDGVGVSSDEDEEESSQPVVVSKTPAPSTYSTETTDLWDKIRNRPPQRQRTVLRDPVEDNIMAIDFAKERMQEQKRETIQRRESDDSVAVDSATSLKSSSNKLSSVSRKSSGTVPMVPNHHNKLSGSSNEGVDGREVKQPSMLASQDDATRWARNAPSSPPTDVKSPSTRSVSRTLLDRPRGQIPPAVFETISDEPLEEAPQKPETFLSPSTSQPKLRQTSVASSAVSPKDTTGVFPSKPGKEPLHMMSVTEEEMIMLEMIRNKRAAMQKSIPAGMSQLPMKGVADRIIEEPAAASGKSPTTPKRKEEQQNELGIKDSIKAMGRQEHESGVNRIAGSDSLQNSTASGLELDQSFPQPPARHSRLIGGSVDTSKAPEFRNPFLPSPPSNQTPTKPTTLANTTFLSSTPSDSDLDESWLSLLGGRPGDRTSTFPKPPSIRHSTAAQPEPRGRQRLSLVPPAPFSRSDNKAAPRVPERSPKRPLPTIESSPERPTAINGRRLSRTPPDAEAPPPPMATGLRKTVSAFPLRRESLTLLSTSITTTAVAAEKDRHARPQLLQMSFIHSPDSGTASPTLCSPLSNLSSAVESTHSGGGGGQPPPRKRRQPSDGSFTRSVSAGRAVGGARRPSITSKVPLPPRSDVFGLGKMASYGPGSSVVSPTSEMSSASDDVLAAWAGLGGTHTRDSEGIAFL